MIIFIEKSRQWEKVGQTSKNIWKQLDRKEKRKEKNGNICITVEQKRKEVEDYVIENRIYGGNENIGKKTKWKWKICIGSLSQPVENNNFFNKRIRVEQRCQRVLIRLYLYTFENDLSDIKILVEDIKSTLLKKQKKIGKTERTEKKQKNLQKAEFFC